MPARDSGSTPHPAALGTTPTGPSGLSALSGLGGPPGSGPVLPTYHHGGRTRSASSSSFARASDTSPHSGVRRRVSQGDGFVGKILRRLSVSTDLEYDSVPPDSGDDLADESAFAGTEDDYEE